MRRVVGIILVALGVFALSLGLMLHFVVYERLALAPLDPDTETVAQGTGMTVFYPESLKNPAVPRQRTDATVTATRVVHGKLGSPDVKIGGDVALWRVGLVLEDEQFALINAVEQWVCVNRHNAEGVHPCRDQKLLAGDEPETDVDFTGLNYKFPFDTDRREYRFFDLTLRQATPIRYDGDQVINGLHTYRFVQVIDPVQIDSREVPGDLVGGEKGTSVTATRHYRNVRTVWVEPYTGIIVKGQEEVRQTLRGPGGGELVLLAGTLTFTPETIQRQVDSAGEARSKLRLLKDVGPMSAWALGWLTLLAGLLALFAGPRGLSRHRDHPPTADQSLRQPETVG